MKHLKLIAKTDHETGELGLMVAGTPVISYPMVAHEGRLIAHDILEHQNGLGSIGSVGDEVEALGGVWFIRGQFSDLSRDGYGSMYSPEENLAADLTNLARIYHDGVPLRVDVKNTKTTDDDESFEEMISIAKRDVLRELDGCEIDHKRLAEYFSACLDLLRTGYRKAARRFGSAHRANSLFWAVAQAVEPYARHVEHEGQEFRLSYGNGSASCQEVFEDEYYH